MKKVPEAGASQEDSGLAALAYPPRVLPENERLAQYLWDHFAEWFAFASDPHIKASNWRAEQAFRPAVVNRKVWGGNRTPAGAQAQSVLLSVFETCRRLSHQVLDYLSHTLCSVGNRLLPRPVLLPTR